MRQDPTEDYTTTSDPPGPAEKLPEVSVVPRRPDTILLVEDEDHIREDTSYLLTTLGYNVIAAANGAEGIAKFLQHVGYIDVLMTDLIMPEVNGALLAQTLCRLDPFLKVIFISGFSGGGQKDTGYFLEKPFTREMLAETLTRVTPT